MTKLTIATVTLAAAAGIAAFVQHQSNVKLQQENQALREQTAQLDELEKLRAEKAEMAKTQAQATNDQFMELLRLRGELVPLKRQAAEMAKMQAEITRLRQQLQQPQPQQQQFQPQPPPPPQPNPQLVQDLIAKANSCLVNLKQLDGAKESWGLENRKRTGDIPTFQDLDKKYLKNIPVCPAGGQYNLNPLGQNPTCTVPGHRLGP